MAGQSLAMGEAFGKGFQYGKRKISSMSNEEFNKLDFQELSESLATDYRVMIPSLVESIKASDRLQDAVFKALADVIKDIPSQILDFFGDVSGTSRSAINTTTSTSASTLGTLTEVRAGSGLGDIRKQQEAIKEQNLQRDTSGQTLAEFERIRAQKNAAQERLNAAARARTESEAKSRKEELALKALVERRGVVTSKRKAGQSQIEERNRLLALIAQQAQGITGRTNSLSRGGTQNPRTDRTIIRWRKQMQEYQATLTILLQRYTF